MNLHEYQAKQVLIKAGVKLPPFAVMHLAEDWKKTFSEKLQGMRGDLVVKAQIHAGGRGKGKIFNRPQVDKAELVRQGGVQLVQEKDAKNTEFSANLVETMLGNYLQTAQTGANVAKKINHVYIEQATRIEQEFYLSFFLDGNQPTVMYSMEGGVNIEEVAQTAPEKIHFAVMDLHTGLHPFQCREILVAFGLVAQHRENIALLNKLSLVFLKNDCSLLEINPLVLENETGRIIPLDCKLSLDSNASYRHADLLAMRDIEEEEHLEVQASEYNLNYVKLDGSVGCMVNGAGLAMATMDFVKPLGGQPANFLDIGGGANIQTVANGFRILNQDTNVRIIFINIFGGIVQCDRVANGILSAMQTIEPKSPLLVRLQGTHAEEAREIFAQRKQEIPVECQVVEDLRQAANILQDFFKKH